MGDSFPDLRNSELTFIFYFSENDRKRCCGNSRGDVKRDREITPTPVVKGLYKMRICGFAGVKNGPPYSKLCTFVVGSDRRTRS